MRDYTNTKKQYIVYCNIHNFMKVRDIMEEKVKISDIDRNDIVILYRFDYNHNDIFEIFSFNDAINFIISHDYKYSEFCESILKNMHTVVKIN